MCVPYCGCPLHRTRASGKVPGRPVPFSPLASDAGALVDHSDWSHLADGAPFRLSECPSIRTVCTSRGAASTCVMRSFGMLTQGLARLSRS